jgi:hypothetical protein
VLLLTRCLLPTPQHAFTSVGPGGRGLPADPTPEVPELSSLPSQGIPAPAGGSRATRPPRLPALPGFHFHFRSRAGEAGGRGEKGSRASDPQVRHAGPTSARREGARPEEGAAGLPAPPGGWRPGRREAAARQGERCGRLGWAGVCRDRWVRPAPPRPRPLPLAEVGGARPTRQLRALPCRAGPTRTARTALLLEPCQPHWPPTEGTEQGLEDLRVS